MELIHESSEGIDSCWHHFSGSSPGGPPAAGPAEHDYRVRDFHFKSGETLPELRLHYMTLGTPAKDAAGRVTNAVLILHGTGGSGRQFLQPQFAGVLFGPGQLLDASRYFIILPDNVGHGKSSKPSDGMRAHFPSYDYDDMVAAQHELLEKGLGIHHLRLVLGTSMGCMHSWVWAETYPQFMDAVMPLACLPVQIAGRNRISRKMIMDGIRNDPEWKNGEYTAEPRAGIQLAMDLLFLLGGAPLLLQTNYPRRTPRINTWRNTRRGPARHSMRTTRFMPSTPRGITIRRRNWRRLWRR
jgi:homoserine O-acetyltransferase